MKVIYKNGETVRCDYIINNNGSIEAVQNADEIDETIIPLDLDAVDTIIGRGTVSYADSFGGVELTDITLLIVENDIGIIEAVDAGGESCEIDVTAFTEYESSERF